MEDVFSSISVVVPVYNQSRQLLECLRSLYAMDYPSDKLEVIVVDDGSAEDIEGIIQGYYPLVRVIKRTHNGGCDSARQEGIHAASGSIIANTDADCVVSAGWARRINKLLSGGCSAVTGPVLHSSGLMAQFVAITQFGHFQGRKERLIHTFPGCNFAARRDVLDKFGYKKEELRDGSDRLLAWRLIQSGCRVLYDPQMVVYHHPPLSLTDISKRWIYYSGATYCLRLFDRSLPGGGLLRLGFLAPGLFACARLFRDYQRLFALLVSGRIKPVLAPVLTLIFPLMRAVDAVAMLRVHLKLSRR